jgi:hypothetical protein
MTTQLAETFNGKPCRKCGGTLRYVAQKRCVACRATIQRAYLGTDGGKVTHARSRANNLDSARVYARVRRTIERRAALPSTDKPVMRAFVREAVFPTRLSGQPWHVDHVVPLNGATVSGLNTHWNLEVIPGARNLAKNNRFTQSDATRPLPAPVLIVKTVAPGAIEGAPF